MKLCLAALCLALLGLCQEATGFASNEAEGKWYVAGIATQCEKILKHGRNMKTVPLFLNKQEDGSVRIKTSLQLPNGCKDIEMDFQQQEDGVYTHKCEWGEKYVDTMDTDNVNYAITVMRIQKSKAKGKAKAKANKTSVMVTVAVRTLPLTSEIEEKFRAKAKEMGLTDEQIIIAHTDLACDRSE